jgi:hypothetical protein
MVRFKLIKIVRHKGFTTFVTDVYDLTAQDLETFLATLPEEEKKALETFAKVSFELSNCSVKLFLIDGQTVH